VISYLAIALQHRLNMATEPEKYFVCWSFIQEHLWRQFSENSEERSSERIFQPQIRPEIVIKIYGQRFHL